MEGYSSGGSTPFFTSKRPHESQFGFETGSWSLDDISLADETEWTTLFEGSFKETNESLNEQLNRVETSEASFRTGTRDGAKSNLTPAQREKKRQNDAKYRKNLKIKAEQQVTEIKHLKAENEGLNAENTRLRERIRLLLSERKQPLLPSNEEAGLGNESEADEAEFSSGGAEEDEPSVLDGISGEPSTKLALMPPDKTPDLQENRDLTQDLEQLDLEPDINLNEHMIRYTLVGRVIADHTHKLISVRNILSKAWHVIVNGEFKVKQLQRNTFLFLFETEEDMNRIFNERPWSVNFSHLNLKKWTGGTDINELDFSKSAFWVRIHRLPFEMYTVKNVLRIGKLFPTVLVIETDDNGKIELESYIRMKVEILVDKPLVVGFIIKRGPHAGKEVAFSYERLSDFCYHCGSLKHVLKDCSSKEKIKGNHRYGPWLRAVPADMYQFIRPSNFTFKSFPLSIENAEKEDLNSVDSCEVSDELILGLTEAASELSPTQIDVLAIEEANVQQAMKTSSQNSDASVRINPDQACQSTKKVPAMEGEGKGEAVDHSPPSSPDTSPSVSPKCVLSSSSSSAVSNQVAGSSSSKHFCANDDSLLLPIIQDQPPVIEELSSIILLSPLPAPSLDLTSPYELIFSGPDLAKAVNNLDFLTPIEFTFNFRPSNPTAKTQYQIATLYDDPISPRKRIKLSDNTTPLLTDLRDTVPLKTGSALCNKNDYKMAKEGIDANLSNKTRNKTEENHMIKEGTYNLNGELVMLPPIKTTRTKTFDEEEIEKFFNFDPQTRQILEGIQP